LYLYLRSWAVGKLYHTEAPEKKRGTKYSNFFIYVYFIYAFSYKVVEEYVRYGTTFSFT
jgi:hypothetical protein